ncbi:hypothetical protein D3C71_1597270 [compost metagenome]
MVDRLQRIVEAAELQRFAGVFEPCVSGQEHDQRVRESLMNPAQQLQSVRLLHLNVGDDKIDRLPFHNLHGGFDAAGFQNSGQGLVAPVDALRNSFECIYFIIHDQHVIHHQSPPFRLWTGASQVIRCRGRRTAAEPAASPRRRPRHDRRSGK